MELSKDGKILWVYLITKCDHAGIIKLNEKLCKTQTGLNDVKRGLTELDSRLYRLTEFNLFIPGYLFFQYTGFPNSKVLQQRGAISILEKLGLIKDGVLTISTPRDGVERRLTPIGDDIVNEVGNDKGDQQGETDLKKAWADFLAMRKVMKKQATPRAIELIEIELEKLAPGDDSLKIKILEQSTLKNWTDVYALKKDGGSKEAYYQPTEKDYSEKL
jgi:hypothetical protein